MTIESAFHEYDEPELEYDEGEMVETEEILDEMPKRYPNPGFLQRVDENDTLFWFGLAIGILFGFVIGWALWGAK